MCDNYGPCDRYEKLEAEISECGHDIALLRADNARLRAERDAAREEVERLRADLLEALPSVYAEMGLTDYVKDLHRELAQLTQTLNAARAAAATWKRAAKLWRGVSQLGDGYDGMMYRLVRRSDGHE